MDENSSNPALIKYLKPIHLWAIAVGLVISGDYFGWNYGLAKASPMEFILSVLFVTIFYITFAFSFTELSSSIPKAGGPFAYSRKALGDTGGFLAGFATLIEFLLASPATASALGAYIHFLFPEVPAQPAAILSIILFTGINLLGIKQTANFELFVTIVASAGVLLFMLLVVKNFNTDNILPSHEFSLSSFFYGIPFAFWFYLAMEGVAMAAEETENPIRDIPRGFALAIGTLSFFAIGVTVFCSGLGNIENLSKSDNPLSESLLLVFGEKSWFLTLFTYFGIFGLMASLLGIILGYSRQIYALSREGYLPEFLSLLNKKNHIPYLACISGGVIGIIALVFGKPEELITLSALGAVFMYIISMISFFVLRLKNPEMERPFIAPFYPYFPILALVMGIICLFSMLYFHPFSGFIFLIALLLNYILFLITFNSRN